MRIRNAGLDGAWVFSPQQHHDERGVFLEAFTATALRSATGRDLSVAQINVSISRRGVVRGIHAARTPPGQAKYVQCLTGRILDVIVDIRPGSASFGEHFALELNDATREAVFISEGLGHGFCVLSDSATVAYATSTPYDPDQEFGIDPLDPALALPWPTNVELILSDKDRAAPSLAEALSLMP